MRGPAKKDFVEKIRETWGEDAPAWIVALAEACTRDRQSAVATRLGVSPSMISAALSGTYGQKGGDLSGLEAKVRGAYLGETVACPVIGDIGTDRCRSEQREPFRATSAMRAQLYHACKTCSNREVKP